MKDEKNHSGTAAVLSFVFSGLGQLYNGHIVKGLIIIFFTGLSLLLVVLGAALIYVWFRQQVILQLLWSGIGLLIVGLILICVLGIYSIVDAYRQAR
ncbi:MAG: hypothetical protein PHS93_07020 [Candidatus Omnitrophica bacterium]|nr:hypothetical protein [Candidatus Omnitrophota bacterium]MDD5352893.1 hypothetical protein [Candidatus Omnitrophota bacterium]MDD5550492.1 hypothetical protein [Candidatus Omnitrophota bacterium]